MREINKAANFIIDVGRIIRFIPVISWTICSIILGIASGYYEIQNIGLRWIDLILIFSTGVIFHGIIAHALNDVWDTRTGTDIYSPGILSGGSGVLINGHLKEYQVIWLFRIGIFAGFSIGIYYFILYGWYVLIFLAVGLWSSIAYSSPSLCLSYKPFAGEWMASWPALVTCTVGASFITTGGTITYVGVAAGMIHATLSIGLLMEHHLADLEADQRAVPKKHTTVLWTMEKWGWERAVLPGIIYFALAGALGWWFGYYLHKALYISCLTSILCIIQAIRTHPAEVDNITMRELTITGLIWLNTVAISGALIFLKVYD